MANNHLHALRDGLLIAAIDAMTTDECERDLRAIGIDVEEVMSRMDATIRKYGVSPVNSRFKGQVAGTSSPNHVVEVNVANHATHDTAQRVYIMQDHLPPHPPPTKVAMLIVPVGRQLPDDIAADVRAAIRLLLLEPGQTLPVAELASRFHRPMRYIRNTLVKHARRAHSLYSMDLVSNDTKVRARFKDYEARHEVNEMARDAIASFCGDHLVRSGDIVILDGGDQTQRIAAAIRRRLMPGGDLDNISFVSNNFKILSDFTIPELGGKKIHMKAVGGDVRIKTASAHPHGRELDDEFSRQLDKMREAHADAPVTAFIGATRMGLDGLAVMEKDEQPTKEGIIRKVLAAGGKVYVAADSSKYEPSQGPYVFQPYSQCSGDVAIVCDAELPKEFCDRSNLIVQHHDVLAAEEGVDNVVWKDFGKGRP